MRITYLHQYFLTPEMSGGTRSYEMARRLVRAGHEVHLVTSDTNPQRDTPGGWRVTEEAGIHVHWLPVPYSNHMSYGQRLRAFGQFALSSTARAAQLPSDVIFATSTPLTIAFPARYAARRRGVPLVFEIRDLWPEAAVSVGALRNPLLIRAARWLEVSTYFEAAHVVALSPRLREGVLRHGVSEDKVSVIPNGCDFQLFDVPKLEGERFRRSHRWLGARPMVVYAGTIGKVNGLDYLVRVAEVAKQQNPDVCFVVVGSGSEEPKVAEEARRRGLLNENFYLLGRFPKHEIPQILSAADLTLSLCVPRPELALDAANKVFDSMAAGRPIALNYEGDLSDIIHEQQAGIKLDGHDVAGSAKLIVEAVTNRPWLEAAGQAARQLGRLKYHRDVLARQLEEILLRVTETREESVRARAAA